MQATTLLSPFTDMISGIPIVLGTDAGNPLTLHGPSVFVEMETMEKYGMPAMAVLGKIINTPTLSNSLKRYHLSHTHTSSHFTLTSSYVHTHLRDRSLHQSRFRRSNENISTQTLW